MINFSIVQLHMYLSRMCVYGRYAPGLKESSLRRPLKLINVDI